MAPIRAALAGIVGIIVLAGTGWLIYSVYRDLEAVRSARALGSKTHEVVDVAAEVKYEKLALNSIFEWSAERFPSEVVRQAGPYILTITKREENEMAAPVIKLSAGTQSVSFEGEMSSPGFTSKVTLLSNSAGASPIVMLQSFSGGAHCCNHIQLAGWSAGKLKVVDLGSWDGDNIEPPRDISGDGIADFELVDNRFLYAFAPYAMSYAPPKILNVLNGNVVDVSTRPQFRGLFEKAMQNARTVCINGEDGAIRNGACAAYVADAARVGKVGWAWSDMLGAYDASQDWDWPEGCWVSDRNGCPSGQEIAYKSYPEALLAFLKEGGYVPKNWIPPELRNSDPRNVRPEVLDDRTT